MITSQAGRAVTASNQRVHSITSLNVKCKSNRYHAFFIELLYERPRASADMYGGTESTTPATQIAAKLPRTSMEGTQIEAEVRHACHARSSGANRSSCVAELPLTSIYGGTESTMPATQIEAEVLKVSRLPRKIQRRQIGPHASPSFR